MEDHVAAPVEDHVFSSFPPNCNPKMGENRRVEKLAWSRGQSEQKKS